MPGGLGPARAGAAGAPGATDPAAPAAQPRRPPPLGPCRWIRPRVWRRGSDLTSTAASSRSAPLRGTRGRACRATTPACLRLKTSGGACPQGSVRRARSWARRLACGAKAWALPNSLRWQRCSHATPTYRPTHRLAPTVQGPQARQGGVGEGGRCRRPRRRGPRHLCAAGGGGRARRRGGACAAARGGLAGGQHRAARGVWPAAARVQAVCAGGRGGLGRASEGRLQEDGARCVQGALHPAAPTCLSPPAVPPPRSTTACARRRRTRRRWPTRSPCCW